MYPRYWCQSHRPAVLKTQCLRPNAKMIGMYFRIYSHFRQAARPDANLGQMTLLRSLQKGDRPTGSGVSDTPAGSDGGRSPEIKWFG
jgi:hypothetical protein